MKHTMNSLLAFGESTLAFLAAWCMMSHVSIPKVHTPSHRSSILPALRGVASSVAKASSRSPEISQYIKHVSLDNQLALIGSRHAQVMHRINKVYSQSR